MFSRTSNARPRVSLVLAAVCWGLGTVFSKAARAYFPPITLLVTQTFASLIVLWPVLRLRRTAVQWKRKFLALSLLGWLNPGISYTIRLIGLSLTTASASALLWAMEPLLIVALAWLFLRAGFTSRFLVLGAVAVGGVFLVVGTQFGGPGVLLGDGLIMSGVVCCAFYTVPASRLGEGFSPLVAVTMQESLALGWAVLILPVELNRTMLAGLQHVPLLIWGLAALSSVFYYGLAFWLYLDGLQRVTASVAGMSINLVPLFALGGAFLILGEKLAPVQCLSAGLVLAAVVGCAGYFVHRPIWLTHIGYPSLLAATDYLVLWR